MKKLKARFNKPIVLQRVHERWDSGSRKHTTILAAAHRSTSAKLLHSDSSSFIISLEPSVVTSTLSSGRRKPGRFLNVPFHLFPHDLLHMTYVGAPCVDAQ